MPINTYTGPAIVTNITFDIWLEWTQVSLSFESDECNQSPKYEIEIIFFLVLTLILIRWYFHLFSHLGSPDDLDASLQKNNDSHVSGISPFFSSEDMNVSLNNTPQYCESVSTPKRRALRIFIVFNIVYNLN